jgi:hypothetical protein
MMTVPVTAPSATSATGSQRTTQSTPPWNQPMIASRPSPARRTAGASVDRRLPPMAPPLRGQHIRDRRVDRGIAPAWMVTSVH